MNFCFVVNDLLSASSQPGKNRRIKYYMDLYKENNIKVLVSLYKRIDLPEEYTGQFQTYYFKWRDMENDNIGQLDYVVDVILKHISKKEAVNVNCEAGITESAVVLTATIMKYLGLPYRKAFEKVREQRYAMEDEASFSLLRAYESFLRKSGKLALAKSNPG